MRTDEVLTMEEYLTACYLVESRVSPPGPDAHHIPIIARGDVDSAREPGSRRCDRWGRLLGPVCPEHKTQTCTTSSGLPLAKK